MERKIPCPCEIKRKDKMREWIGEIAERMAIEMWVSSFASLFKHESSFIGKMLVEIGF